MSEQDGLKRYSLVISESMFDEVQRTAEEDHTAILDQLRRFIKLGLYITRIAKGNPNSQIIIREKGKEQEILFFI